MANEKRGEVEAEIAGASLTFCLTLGALGELEAALGGEDIFMLAQRLAEEGPKARELTLLLSAALAAGSGMDMEAARGAVARLEMREAARLAARLLRVTFAGRGDGEAGATKEEREGARPFLGPR